MMGICQYWHVGTLQPMEKRGKQSGAPYGLRNVYQPVQGKTNIG